MYPKLTIHLTVTIANVADFNFVIAIIDIAGFSLFIACNDLNLTSICF